MAAELILTPEAAQDIDEAYAWYEDRRVGLGEEFLGAIDARIHYIRRYPESQQVIHETYRRAVVRRFPYAIFIRVHRRHRNDLLGLSHVPRSREVANPVAVTSSARIQRKARPERPLPCPAVLG